MGKYSNVDKSKFNEGGVYFKEGNHLVRIERVKDGETRAKIGYFLVECVILESSNPEHRPGSSVSWITMADKDAFLGNVNHFCSVATGVDPSEVDEEGVLLLVSEDNPLGGAILAVEAKGIKTKAGNDFTKIVWKQPTPEQQAKYATKAA